jgi:hypothetical protein
MAMADDLTPDEIAYFTGRLSEHLDPGGLAVYEAEQIIQRAAATTGPDANPFADIHAAWVALARNERYR